MQCAARQHVPARSTAPSLIVPADRYCRSGDRQSGEAWTGRRGAPAVGRRGGTEMQGLMPELRRRRAAHAVPKLLLWTIMFAATLLAVSG